MALVALILGVATCSSGDNLFRGNNQTGGGTTTSTTTTGMGSGGTTSSTAGSGGQPQGGGGQGGLGGAGGAGGRDPGGDPQTCEQAAAAKTYIGCEFWPTVTPNLVWSIFDYAVVVANAGKTAANVTVTRGNQTRNRSGRARRPHDPLPCD